MDVSILPKIKDTPDEKDKAIDNDPAEVNINDNYTRMKESLNESRKLRDEVYRVADLLEANKHLRALTDKKCCIRDLTFEGHGGPGMQSVGPLGDGRTIVWPRFLGVLRVSGKYIPQGFDVFRGVTFCTPCKIILRGCSVGAGIDVQTEATAAYEFALLLRNATGCSVYGYLETCHSPEKGGRTGEGVRSAPNSSSIQPPAVLIGPPNGKPILEDIIKQQRKTHVPLTQ